MDTRPLRTRGIALGGALALTAMLLAGSPPGEPPAPRPDIIAAELRAQAGDAEVEALVVLERGTDAAPLSRAPEAATAALKRAADRAQPDVVRLVEARGGEVLARLWLQNAVVVRGRLDTLLAVSGIEGVARIVPNATVTAPAPPADTDRVPAATVDDRTWGVDRVGAHRVWQELGLDGSGVRVATLDTGVDPAHPDLAGKLVTDDPADSLHPGGWIAFAGGGEPFPVEPVDSHGHGTHVSGTVHGGDASGAAIGVAPGAEMMHAMVLPGGTGDIANIIAGMQWAMAPYDARGLPAGRPADVVNMSLGEVGFVAELVEPVRNLRAAGIVPVVAIGNDCGLGGTASPGNVYEAIGVGATDAEDDVADFSCGSVIGRDQWPDPPEDWPDSYLKPDLAAPGVEVLSAFPGGSHTLGTGTSMATPHVAGAAALMLQAVPETAADQVLEHLADTAFFDERHGPERPNPRFGHGRIDAYAAVEALLPAGGVAGTVVDASDREPVADAAVRVAGADRGVTAGPDGRYQLRLEPGTYDLEVTRFGYQPATYPGITVTPDRLTPLDPELAPIPTGSVSGRVSYEPSGSGVPAARVDVLGQPVETVSDADGGFDLDLPEGDYRLRASASRLRPSLDVPVTVTAGAVTEVELPLRPLGRTEQVDVASDGTPANTASSSPSISADGRYVAFQSAASNLVPGATNGQPDIYVHDRRTGVTERVSVASDGTESDGSSHRPAISADGRFVAFDGTATNLVDPPLPPGGIHTFVHDRRTGETELVSQSTGGEPANDWSRDAAISGDGRYVLFGSQATNLVPGPVARGHIYLRDRAQGTTEIASVAGDGTPANNSSQGAAISDDGSQVAFHSNSTNLDENIRNEVFDVFVHERDAAETTRVSVSTDGQEAQGGANTQTALSGNGRVAAWDSRAHNLDQGDTNDVYDVFVHDRDTGQTTRVSLSSGGEQGNLNSRSPAVSGNGRYVAFESASDTLADGVTNGTTDVFVRDRVAGTTTRESLGLDGAEANGPSGQQVLDHEGRFLAFRSFATNLVEPDAAAPASLFVRDRVGPDGRQPQFAVWDLRVEEPVVLAPGPVDVSVRVTNIGGAAGTYPAELRVAGRPEAHEDVALAAGESTRLEWTVEREELGSYQVQVGPERADFRVRAPVVDLSVSTLEGPDHDRGPLAGATVGLVDADGELTQVGGTDPDGRLRFEVTARDAEYTIVAHRDPVGGHELSYLLTRQLRVAEDVRVELSPHTGGDADAADPAALVDLQLDGVTGGHEAWTYLRHPLAAPHGFAFPPGPLAVTTADSFEAVNVHAVTGLARDTWAVSEVVDGLAWRDPVGYEYEFGGPAAAALTADLDGTTADVSWAVTDAAGHDFAEFRRTGLRPFAARSVPDPLPLEEVAGLVADRAPEPAEVILRLLDPDGEPVHAGGVGWAERDLTWDLVDLLDRVTAGTYPLQLEIDAGNYGGTLTATTELAVDARETAQEALLVLAGAPDLAPVAGDRAGVLAALRGAAEQTQAEVIAGLPDGTRVVNRFWLQNMLLVEHDPGFGALSALSALDGVDRVVPNFEVSLIEPEPAGAGVAVVGDRTWGIDRIEAHRVHRELAMDGSGVVVATLDTGVDLSHPDLAGRMLSDDPADPAHPGGWLQFDGAGQPVASTPHDSAQHGTHVSGTIHGGSASGVQIGVAPGAGLRHGLVLPGGTGTFAQVVAGMQWALDPFDATGAPAGQPADIVNMSLGAEGFHQEMVEPTRNLRLAGVFPAISIGNDCAPGGTSSPGNVYEAVGIGATDRDDGVADFSCGGTVDTDRWPAPPPDWPERYVKPDLSAPGVEVRSSVPGGGYLAASGTSMAAPHVAGTAALMLQAAPETGPDRLLASLADTALFDGRHGPERPNDRFGHGRINAYQATLAVAVESGISGTVVDAGSGAPIAGARVENATTGAWVTTDTDGSYRMRLHPGSYDLTTETFGYQPGLAEGIQVVEDTVTTHHFALEPLPSGSLVGSVTMADSGLGVPGVPVEVAGTPLRTTTDAAGSFEIPVVPEGDYVVSASPTGLADPAPQDVAIREGETTTAGFTVATPAPTVGLLGDRNGAIGEFLDEHDIPHETVDWDADVSRYGAIVVNQPGDPGERAFLEFLDATDAAGVGLIFHDTWSSFGNGIELLHTHVGNPAERDRGFSGSIDYLYYEVTAEHPVLAGFEVGEQVVLNNRTSTREHAWFDGYQGEGRQMVADAARNDTGVVGRGIGVQQRENNRHVLLSMHATGSILRTDDWGPDGEQVFRNALEWVTPARDAGVPVLVPWDLAVDPEVVLTGDAAEVSVKVSNVGTAAGEYRAELRVDDEVEDTTAVTVTAGETTTVTWTLSRADLGTYQVAVGPLTTTFRVRAPVVDLSVSALDGAGPLAGAVVELIQDGRRIPVGSTDADGRASFETTRPEADYAIVVRRPPAGGGEPAYLLVRPEHIDDDVSIALTPGSQDPVAVVDLQVDRVADDEQTWTYVRHPLAAPHSFAFAPGQLVTTVAPDDFELVNVHRAPGLARDWWAVSEIVGGLEWRDPVVYEYAFGGPAAPELDAAFTDDREFRVEWAVTDGHGHRFAAVRATRLRPFAAGRATVPDTAPLEQVASIVAGQAPVAAEVILELSDPGGEPVHAGGLAWDQPTLSRDLAELVDQVTDGSYRLRLETDTGTHSGPLTAEATLTVDTEPPELVWDSPRDGQGFLDPQITVEGTVTDAVSGVTEILVNGEPAELDPAGSWRLELPLGPGENKLRVEAVDAAGNDVVEVRTVARLDYADQWVVSGRGAATPVLLRIVDADGRSTQVGEVQLEAVAADGTVHGPFEMEWRGQRYQHVLHGLPPGRYALAASFHLDGWSVTVPGPAVTTRGGPL